MVEVDIQFLAGVAVTVFLALMFFGVVVLWDVALALRSVGDKIDKLEDNVDDDLKDIGYSLDNISNAPGGGGAQFHLSGGTISSEPTPNQRPEAETQPRGQRPSQKDSPQRSAHPETEAGREQPSSDETVSESQSAERAEPESQAADSTTRTADSESDANGETARTDGADATTDTDQESAVEASADGSDTADPASASDPNAESEPDSESKPDHPRASINRGRFVTSPDRTAWFATPLDREAIANAGPEIAGELEAGDPEGGPTDEPDVIAAGPAPSSDGHESEPSNTGDEPDASEAFEFDESTMETAATNPLTGEADDVVDESADDRASATEADADVNAGGETDPVGRGDTASEPDSEPTPTAERAESDDIESDLTDGAIEPSVRSESASESESKSESESESDSDSDRGLETGSEPATETETERKAGSELEPDSAAESPNSTRPDSSSDGELADAVDAVDVDDTSAESFTDFEFSDLTADDETEQTVDEAIDSMNDETPSLSLSSHGFEVTADADDDGAVLTFEFDPDTVEITGSTKRLLRYQMRSFAEKESTPDGDVTIEGNTIVVDLPEADGDAVSRWGEAAVEIIDRTLYLSDNSS
ncbi:AAA family ATPase [Halobacteria archaeon AArc-m2/3/4]|uniref:AAA family ATPase n=1 Tax=Natronoglomus mannanivorans TaxID=2979990 RepID=A0ABT2Q9G3_9EURY|nr:AAA family ATPase [Halobacteria archaeon AArc-m2/3/4]